MMLVPPSDRVLIRQCEPEAETAFGLMLPQTALKESQRGIVIAVGEGAYDRNGVQHPLGVYDDVLPDIQDGKLVEVRTQRSLKIGDEVVLPRFGGTSLEFDGDEYVSILASELLAVVA